MNNDRPFGALIMVGSIIGILIYIWLVFFTEWSLLALKFTGIIAVGGVLGISSWIGYTMATTPPLDTVEAIDEYVQDETRGEDT